MPRIGREPGRARGHAMHIRLRKEERAEIVREAKREGVSFSEFIRMRIFAKKGLPS